MKVYLLDSATRAQIAAVGRRLRADADVARVRFISKEAALRQIKKKYPDLVEDLVFNPLPNSFELAPRRWKDGPAIVERLQPLPAGVEEARINRFACKRAQH